MQIRRALPEDAHAIAQVHVASWRHAYRDLLEPGYLAQLSVERRAALWTRSIADGVPEVLVATADAGLAGFVAFGPCRDADAAKGTMEVWAFYLEPESWSRGTGRALWLAARERMSGQGAMAVSLWVIEDNRRAIRFYEAAGFALDAAVAKEVTLGSVRLKERRYAQTILR